MSIDQSFDYQAAGRDHLWSGLREQHLARLADRFRR